jgi:hypothetical protein
MCREVLGGHQPATASGVLCDLLRERPAVERVAVRVGDQLERAGVILAAEEFTRVRRATARQKRRGEVGKFAKRFDGSLPRRRRSLTATTSRGAALAP